MTLEELQAQLNAANERLRAYEDREINQIRQEGFAKAITEFNLSDKGVQLLRSTGMDDYLSTKKWIEANKDNFGDILFKEPLATMSQPTQPGRIEQIDPSKKQESKVESKNPNDKDYWNIK